MLFVSKYVVSVNVSHDFALYDRIHDYGADGGQRYWSIVARGGLVAFLIHGKDVRGQPVVSTSPVEMDLLKMRAREGAISSAASLSSLPGIPSGPVALLGWRFFRS